METTEGEESQIANRLQEAKYSGVTIMPMPQNERRQEGNRFINE
eukprot:CAMPEP_0170460228 /NCGR_PEP_ID=MMETSP0123-20130129/6679_1 /TAXON_ID=182087 /ORGANISM="Favella ehrenbergii, Strain Fehren 1" /LENGTH=43 /DNA_ID= /DNA_START= /DNA_END= /DNA_ORIENTATION=